jgi:hypothetical protein
MRRTISIGRGLSLEPVTILLLLLALATPSDLRAQDEPNLDAKQHIFSEVGAGFRAIRRGPSGHYYVLVAPGPAVLVFDAAGKKLQQVPSQPTGAAAIVFGASLDVDAAGQIYVADRGGNAVKIYAADGTLAASIPVSEPTSVAALPGGEVAVASLNADNLIAVYDSHGKLLRSFGELADLADSPELNHRLNLGYLLADASGNLYYAFEYLPEPTVRKYDSVGYLQSEFSITTLDFQGLSQAARREIAKSKPGVTIVPHQIISAIGLDSASQEIWLALGDVLLRLSPGGDILVGMRTYGPSGERIETQSILIEPGRLLLGNDPMGIFAAVTPKNDAPAH